MEIIKNKPRPVESMRGGRPIKYPFADMEVGDCIAAGATRVESKRVRCAATAHAKLRGNEVAFSVSKVGDEWFIWRTK